MVVNGNGVDVVRHTHRCLSTGSWSQYRSRRIILVKTSVLSGAVGVLEQAAGRRYHLPEPALHSRQRKNEWTCRRSS